MDERSADARGGAPRKPQRRSLVIGGAHFPIVSENPTSCLIQAPPGLPAGMRMRGYADIYDGERHRAHCLVVLCRAEGEFLRVIYKQRTEARRDPPADYEALPPPAPEQEPELAPASTPARAGMRRRAWLRLARKDDGSRRGDRSPA